MKVLNDSEFSTLVANIDRLETISQRNALGLIFEAEHMLEKGYFARAYFLAVTALEEFNKSVILKDYESGLVSSEKLKKMFEDHAYKLSYGSRKFDGTSLRAPRSKVLKKARERSLYSGLSVNGVSDPEKLFTKVDAEELIALVKEDMDSLFTAEWMNDRLGTKALVK